MIIKTERVTNIIVMFFFSRFSMHTDIPHKKKSSCRLRTFTVCLYEGGLATSWKERGGIAVFLSLSLSSSLPFYGGPATRLCLVTTTAYIYVITSSVWLVRPLAKWEEKKKMAQQYLCVRVAIMDNKSLAAILWRSLLSLGRVSTHKYIHTSIIAYRAVRFRWHRILVMHVLVLL